MLFLSVRPTLFLVQSRSLSGRHVSTGFLDPVLGAMMKQVCWHSRRSKAYRGCPRHAWQELLWKKPPLRTSTCGRHRFRKNHPFWEPRMWQGQVWEARPDGESTRGKAKFGKRHGSCKWEEENSSTRRRHRGKGRKRQKPPPPHTSILQHCKKRNGSWKKGWKRGRCDVGTWPLQMMEWEGGGGNVSKLLLLLCAKVRNYYRRDRSGTAAGTQNVGIPTIPGCRRDRSRPRRDHFSCKFIGAGPHTPFGNYNNIPGGVRWCFGGGVWEESWRDILSI